MNIIAIDDEMDALHLFLDQIISVEKNVGYKFFKDDEESVLSYVKNNHVDGAFIDVNLPRIGDMGGLLLLRKILKISPSTKAIMVTGTSLAMEDIPNDISGSVLGIIYKPISTMKLQEYILNLGGLSSTMKVKTFGQFDCFVNDHLVNFSSSKSKELFALLIALNGKSLTMEHAITLLWPDRPIDQAKIIYRDAVWRLRASLK